MISSTQLEAFYERYQREGVPNDLSMQAFCSMHNVPYNCFERHFRQRTKFRNIKPALITGLPETDQLEAATDEESIAESQDMRSDFYETEAKEKVRLLVAIKMSNGFQIHRSNIDYRTLLGLQFVTVRKTPTPPATVLPHERLHDFRVIHNPSASDKLIAHGLHHEVHAL